MEHEYKDRIVSDTIIQEVIDEIANGVFNVPNNRQARRNKNMNQLLHIIGRDKFYNEIDVPCKVVMEEACRRTDPTQPPLRPQDHISQDAERYLRNHNFPLSR